jgi:hypothetical protein
MGSSSKPIGMLWLSTLVLADCLEKLPGWALLTLHSCGTPSVRAKPPWISSQTTLNLTKKIEVIWHRKHTIGFVLERFFSGIMFLAYNSYFVSLNRGQSLAGKSRTYKSKLRECKRWALAGRWGTMHRTWLFTGSQWHNPAQIQLGSNWDLHLWRIPNVTHSPFAGSFHVIHAGNLFCLSRACTWSASFCINMKTE